jgi:hypothetical protein
MAGEVLEERVYVYCGIPQVIPADLTPEAVYGEEGIGESTDERISFWEQKYSSHDFSEMLVTEERLASLEDLYLQDLVTSGDLTD